MWQGKAASAAALLLCAQGALADGLSVRIGGFFGGGDRGRWHEREKPRHRPRQETPRCEPRYERPRYDGGRHQRPRQPAPCVEERRATLCLDGRDVNAFVSVWVDDCGRVRTRVRLEACHGELPALEEVRVELDQDCLDYCEALCRVDRSIGRSTAVYEGVGGMWYEGCARVELRVKTCRETARANWKEFRVEQL